MKNPIEMFIILLVAILLPQFIPPIASLFTGIERIVIPIISFFVMVVPIVVRVVTHFSVQRANVAEYNKNEQLCIVSGMENCCIDEYLASLTDTQRDEPMLQNRKLMLEEKMNEYEREFGAKISEHPDREVWIFSYDLNTEVLGDTSQKISAVNVNLGLKYIYFHTDNPQETHRIEDNKKKIRNSFQDGKTATFIPLDNDQETGIDIMAFIMGSIIFVSSDEGYDCSLSYFSLRGSAGKPIYFRLPYCMNNAYYKYFKKAKEENDKNS
jgi:hypothetical protein